MSCCLDSRTRSATASMRAGCGSGCATRMAAGSTSQWAPPATLPGESAAGVDLVRAGELVGRVDLGPRPGGYAAADLELLATVAAQATTAVANVRLATQLKEGLDELSTSRVRLIAAQDAERRRIERDLHDGIQQEVVALIAGLRLARNRLSRDQLTAHELTELQDQAREMLRDLRELADEASTRPSSATTGSSRRWSPAGLEIPHRSASDCRRRATCRAVL